MIYYKLELLFPDGVDSFYVWPVETEAQLWEVMALIQSEGITITSYRRLPDPAGRGDSKEE